MLKKLLSAVAVVTASFTMLATPAHAERLVQHSVSLPDGSTLQVVEYRTGGFFRHQTRMQLVYRCQGSVCTDAGAFNTMSNGGAAYVSPVAAAAWFGSSIRPTRIDSHDQTSTSIDNGNTNRNTNRTNTDVDVENDNDIRNTNQQGQGQLQGQLQVQLQGQIAAAEGGNGGAGGAGGNNGNNDNDNNAQCGNGQNGNGQGCD